VSSQPRVQRANGHTRPSTGGEREIAAERTAIPPHAQAGATREPHSRTHLRLRQQHAHGLDGEDGHEAGLVVAHAVLRKVLVLACQLTR